MQLDDAHKKMCRSLKEKGLGIGEIVAEMEQLYASADKRQLYDKVRSCCRHINPSVKGAAVGVIGDVHAPFNHPNYLQFCKDTFSKYGAKQIVCVGDLVDNHAISRFQSEPSARGAYDELDAAIDQVRLFSEAFPRVSMCKGNHDTIPIRQAATIGMGERYLKPYHSLLGLPKSWVIEDEFIIDNVLYRHGINCMGKNGAINAATQERMSLVMGHAHSFAGVMYSANKRSLIFGMNVGCGIDIDAYAFAYNKQDKNRPILGCGVVINESNAVFVPMGQEYFRN